MQQLVPEVKATFGLRTFAVEQLVQEWVLGASLWGVIHGCPMMLRTVH